MGDTASSHPFAERGEDARSVMAAYSIAKWAPVATPAGGETTPSEVGHVSRILKNKIETNKDKRKRENEKIDG